MKALISVYDKSGIVEFANELLNLGFDLISTGGTYQELKKNGLKVTEIDEITDFPEILDGRVKTLHPKIHGGILYKRKNPQHAETVKSLNIEGIDLVVVNLYPFEDVSQDPKKTLDQKIEMIDIGGPTILRAAAKNWQDVMAITDINDYDWVIQELKDQGQLSDDHKFALMKKVFHRTAQYDSYIANYLSSYASPKSLESETEVFPEILELKYKKVSPLRYGENDHQKAAYYAKVEGVEAFDGGERIRAVDGNESSDNLIFDQLNGKELSYNNLNDLNSALNLLAEFEDPTSVVVKHNNPCGVASAKDINIAYEKSYQSDPISIFGGIVALNRKVNLELAEKLNEIFLEIVIAPEFDQDALEKLKEKKNLRVLRLKVEINQLSKGKQFEIRQINGGLLVQTPDDKLYENLEVVTKTKPTKEQLEDLIFAFKVVKHMKSNAIALAKDQQTIGLGVGQVNRIWATHQAIDQAKEIFGEILGPEATKNSVLASDAFFPFKDCVEAAHQAGVAAIIQPGGSIRDQESIEECDKSKISMVFTKIRHFRH